MATHYLDTSNLLATLDTAGIKAPYRSLCLVCPDPQGTHLYIYKVCGETLATKASTWANWASPLTAMDIAARTRELVNLHICNEEQAKAVLSGNKVDTIIRDEVETGETRVTNAKGGVKADGGKVMPRLLHVDLADALASCTEVLTYGANKYSPTNWKNVEEVRYVDALYRHLGAHHRGELLDADTGQTHLAHAATNILFLLQRTLKPCN